MIDPVPHRGADDGVERSGVGGDVLGLTGDHLCRRNLLAEHGAHAAIGLDGPHVSMSTDEQAGERTGSGAEFEDIDRSGRRAPADGFFGRSRSKAVVTLGYRSERLTAHFVIGAHGSGIYR